MVGQAADRTLSGCADDIRRPGLVRPAQVRAASQAAGGKPLYQVGCCDELKSRQQTFDNWFYCVSSNLLDATGKQGLNTKITHLKRGAIRASIRGIQELHLQNPIELEFVTDDAAGVVEAVDATVAPGVPAG